MLSRLQKTLATFTFAAVAVSPHMPADANVILTLKILSVTQSAGDPMIYHMQTNAGPVNYSNCTLFGPGNDTMTIDLNDPNGELLRDIALDYLQTGKDIMIRTESEANSTDPCQLAYFRIFHQP